MSLLPTQSGKLYGLNDPDSSRDAARSTSDFSASHKGLILEALNTHGPRTFKEVATILRFKQPVAVSRRMSDLKNDGRIRVVLDVNGKPVRKDRAEVYEVTPMNEVDAQIAVAKMTKKKPSNNAELCTCRMSVS